MIVLDGLVVAVPAENRYNQGRYYMEKRSPMSLGRRWSSHQEGKLFAIGGIGVQIAGKFMISAKI